MTSKLEAVLRYSYLVVVCRVAQQASKGDGICDAAQVDEEHSRDRLDVESLIKITGQPRQFPLYVQIQTTTEADVHRQTGYSG